MAAAEYYNPGGVQPSPMQNHRQNQQPPYPLSDAPPPYSAYEPRPQSQPPPQDWARDSCRPAPPQNISPYPVEKPDLPPVSSRDNNQYYGPRDGGAYPPQGYYPPVGGPAMQQAYGGPSGSRPPYRPASRSRSRSSSRDRRNKKKHHRPQQQQKKKSNGVSTFLGAGGGAIIGDSIFPGLGTLSGALLGGLGGHEYGKRRTQSQSTQQRSRARSYNQNDDYYYSDDDHKRGRKHRY